MEEKKLPQWAQSFKSLRDLDWIEKPPPPRRILLSNGPIDWMRWEDDPHYDPPLYLPLGKVGVLAAAGGVGKSTALVQLAVSVACGVPWFETYHVASPGPVLLAMGEEDDDELHRKIFHTIRKMKLNSEQIHNVACNLYPLPLCGQSASMLKGEGISLFPDQLKTAMKEQNRNDWRLIICDPASRFMGADTEIDNAAATKFIEVLESIMKNTPGQPTILIAHHTNKESRKSGSGKSNAVRGASALTDGARWVATMTEINDEKDENFGYIRLRVVKTNYGRPDPEGLLLQRENFGLLSPRQSFTSETVTFP